MHTTTTRRQPTARDILASDRVALCDIPLPRRVRRQHRGYAVALYHARLGTGMTNAEDKRRAARHAARTIGALYLLRVERFEVEAWVGRAKVGTL